MDGRAEGRSVAATKHFFFAIATFADFTGEWGGRRASMYTSAWWTNSGSRVVNGAYIDS